LGGAGGFEPKEMILPQPHDAFVFFSSRYFGELQDEFSFVTSSSSAIVACMDVLECMVAMISSAGATERTTARCWNRSIKNETTPLGRSNETEESNKMTK